MSSDRVVCSQCNALIGPGEYKLAVRAAPATDEDRTLEERTAWLCRRCASRLFVDDEDAEDAG